MFKWLVVIVLITLVGVVMGFAYLNHGDTEIDLYFRSFNAPLALVLSLAFATGVLLTLLVLLPRALGRGRRMRRLSRELEQTRAELKNLRIGPMHGDRAEH